MENQRVAKRHRTGTGSKQAGSKQPVKNPTYRPNNGFMSFINHRKFKARHSKKASGTGSGFSVPLLPTLAVSAVIIVIALAAFNWEDISISMPALDETAEQQATGQTAGQQALKYAATGITELLPGQFPAQLTANPEAANLQPADVEITAVTTAASTTLEDPGQNDLITFEWQQYKVKKGDSVSVIAKNFDVSIGAIISSNDIKNARTLREGTTLRIPNIDGIPYQVKSGDSLSKIAASHNVPLEVILDVNDIKSDHIKAGETLFIPGARMNDIDLRMSLGELFMYPVSSKIVTSRYGMRKDPINGALNYHTGIDLRADTGTTVVASLDGVVSVTGENWLYGKHIIISHDNGYKTLYAHLNSFAVKRGDRVARGRKIAESGNTGYSTGPHLHFSIYDKNNKLINPLELLR